MSIGGLLNGITGPQLPTTTLTLDELGDILVNDRRRATVKLLAARNTTTLRDLSEALAAHEHGDYTTNQRKAVYTSLLQTHLPKLDTMGVIDYDDNRNIAYPTDELDTVAELLAHINQATNGGDTA